MRRGRPRSRLPGTAASAEAAEKWDNILYCLSSLWLETADKQINEDGHHHKLGQFSSPFFRLTADFVGPQTATKYHDLNIKTVYGHLFKTYDEKLQSYY